MRKSKELRQELSLPRKEGSRARGGRTEEEARREETGVVGDERHERHDDAPRDHDGRDEARRADALEQDVGRHLESDIADDCEGESESVTAQRL